MPLPKRWSRFTMDRLRRVSNVYGVYELGDNQGNVLYIGEGKLQDRLVDHMSGTEKKPGVGQFRYETTGSKRRSQQRERSELATYKRQNNGTLPHFNDNDERG